jgi:hypothetical protein
LQGVGRVGAGIEAPGHVAQGRARRLGGSQQLVQLGIVVALAQQGFRLQMQAHK